MENTATPSAPTPAERRAVALVLSAAFMLLADISIINIAGPSIQRSLGATIAEIQLLVAAYQVAYATALITGGRLGDIVGRRKMMMIGTASFTLASLACGLAQSPTQLLVFRAWQGVSAALIYPQVLATLTIVVPPERRARAFSIFGAVISGATIAGPLIAGVLIRLDLFESGWRPIFLIKVPVVILVMILSPYFVPAVRNPNAKRLDLVGAALTILLISALTIPLTIGRDQGWPLWSWISLAATPILAVVILRWESAVNARGGSPLMPPPLWKIPGFRIGLALYLTLFSGVVPFFLYYSIVPQYGAGYGALTAGLSMVPYAIGTMTTSLRSASIVAKHTTRKVLIAGALICSLGSILMVVPLLATGGGDYLALWMAPTMLLTGLGLGLVVPPLLNFVLGTVGTADVGAASGMLSTTQQLGGALGVAVIGVVFFRDLHAGLAHASYGDLRTGLVAAVVLIALGFLVTAVLVTGLARHRPDAQPKKA
jgi:EmrB/QacA subfamily drug resistance transporter